MDLTPKRSRPSEIHKIRKKKIYFLLPPRPVNVENTWFITCIRFVTLGIYWLNIMHILSTETGLVNLQKPPFGSSYDEEGKIKAKSKEYTIEPDWESNFH